jgi:thiol:disulfide interchange protein DsbA
MLKRLLVGLALSLMAFTASAQAPAQGYTELSEPLPTSANGRIEVVEFFWYGCSHCYAFEPYIEQWLKALPSDVEFHRVPAMFNKQWAEAGRVYYTLESMGLLGRLHRPLFDAIHQQHLRITNEGQLRDWLQRQKVDVDKYFATAQSFAVESKLKRAAVLTEASKITGVPALVVNGRYVVSAEVGTQQKMLQITDALIERTRKQAAVTPKK